MRRRGGATLSNIKLSEVADAIRKIQLVTRKEFFIRNKSNNSYGNIVRVQLCKLNDTDHPFLDKECDIAENSQVSLGFITSDKIASYWTIIVTFKKSTGMRNDYSGTISMDKNRFENSYHTITVNNGDNFGFI